MARNVSRLFLSGAILALLPGCGIGRRMAFETLRQLPLRRVTINYELPPPGPAASSAERPDSLAAKTGVAFSDRPEQRLRLSIYYPHPELGSPAFGLASLHRANSEGRLAPGLVNFVALDARESEPLGEIALERDEVEYVIQSLIADGFFDPGERRAGPARLKVQIGRRTRSRRWDHVPALDRLIQRLLQEGIESGSGSVEQAEMGEPSESEPNPVAAAQRPSGRELDQDDRTAGIVPF